MRLWVPVHCPLITVSAASLVALLDNLDQNCSLVHNYSQPVFDRHTYDTLISEEDDRIFVQVTATGGDKNRLENIVYFLTGQGIDTDRPDQSKFDINKTTGEIFVLKVKQ